MEPRLGVHLIVGKGLDAALAEAKSLRIRSAQIFSKSPRTWASGPIKRDAVAQFREGRRRLGIETLAVHASYLLNLASLVPELRERSIGALAEELERAEAYGAEYLVLHTGGSLGEADREAVTRRAARGIRQALKDARAERVMLLLENAAASGAEVGGGFAEIARLLQAIDAPGRAAVCLDTCHAFQAGYDLRDRKGVDALARELDRTVGAEAVRLVHANDSKPAFARGFDRHQHIGLGHIGSSGFRALLRHPSFRDLPFILETPKDSEEADRKNLRTLRELRG